ncbi:MAG TPA: type II 3-dehydroquinate dehydratase [Saprospiraceae bacterium]|nr:type II 3-dehydroquinate dehydratase [Saprospiraceae bacterium]
MWQVPILHGPNLNLLGIREPEIYGTLSFEDVLDQLKQEFTQIKLPYHQSNHEGDLIDWLQHYRLEADAILLNAGAFTHTSIALRDAIQSVSLPVVEIHISNIHARESFRQHSIIQPACIFSVSGMGMDGYRAALKRLQEILPAFAHFRA